MKEITIFIFDAKEGNVVSKDIVGEKGNVIVKKDTVLTLDTIATISSHHILEINIFDPDAVEAEAEAKIMMPSSSTESEGYFDKIRKSERFKKFSESYDADVASVKNSLNNIVSNNSPIDVDELMMGTNKILSENTNSLQLFDMLHSMRQFDDLTYVHCVNVALICSIIGQWLKYSPQDVKTLTLCGILHDIGKVKIPNDILNKPGKLTDTEFKIMKSHVNMGYDILKGQNIDTRIKEACLLHHEKCDGTGYPFNLKSNDIPDFAKIVAVADVYDAMTAARVYRGAMCPFEVIKIMYEDAFTKFDPKFIIPFLKNVASSYIHNDVRLSDGRVGKVILINDSALHLPIVQCGNDFVDLSKQKGLTITAIL